MKLSKLIILSMLIATILLTSCTDKNAKSDETNKFIFEDYTQYILEPTEVNDIMLSKYDNEIEFTADEQKAIDKYKDTTIKVAIPTDSTLYGTVDDIKLGINYYTMLQLEKDLGLKFEYVFETSEEILTDSNDVGLVSGKNQSTLLNIYETPSYPFVGTLSNPYFSINYAAFSKIVYMDDIDIKSVLRSKTGIYFPYFESKIIDESNATPVDNPQVVQSNSIQDLLNQNLEFLVLPENSVAPAYGYKRIKFRNYSYEIISHYIINDKMFDENFISAINKTITPYKEKNLNEYRAKIELIKLKQGFYYTEAEKEFIKKGEPIRTKYMPDTYPTSFYDEETGFYNGKLVALLNRISAVTGLQFEDVSNRDLTISEMLANLYNHDIDLGVSVEDAFNRSQYFRFSDNLIRDNNIYIGYKDSIDELSDIYDYKIGTVSNSSMDKYLTDSFPSKEIYKYETLDSAYNALRTGEVDFLGVSKNTFYYLVNTFNDFDLKNVYTTNIPSNFVFATPKDEDGQLIISIIDKTSAYVEPDELINANYPLSEIDTVSSYRSVLFFRILGIVILGLACLGAYFFYQLRKSKQRNFRIRSLNKKLNTAFDIANVGIVTTKLNTDFFILNENIIQLLGIDLIDTFFQDSDRCILYSTFVNNYLVHYEDSLDPLTDFKNDIYSVKNNNIDKYSTQITVKYGKDGDTVLYYNVVITLEDSESDNIIAVLKDATKETLYEKYENALLYHDANTEAKNRSSAYKFELNDYTSYTFAYINIDNFNQINNSYGHRRGDTTISEIVHSLFNYEHTVDVYRMNGDEFFVILKDFSESIAEEFLDLFRISITFNDYELAISASVGFFTLEYVKTITHDEIINICNFAMLQAKLDGKNRYVYVDSTMLESYKQANKLDSLLKRAIADGDIIPFFQPYINNLTGKVVGYETLMRWRTDDGILAPYLFLSIAIKSGDIFDIDVLMFRYSAIFLKQLQDDGLADEDFVVSSNFTPLSLLNVEPDDLVQIVSEIGVSPKNMTIEITEQIFASDKAFEKVVAIKNCGFNIALDDFSVGHSSMAYLKRFSVDVLKIDKSLLDDTDNKTNLEIFKTVVNLGKSLNAKIIAEGVETEKEVKVLDEAKVAIGQGYFYARPTDQASMYEYIKNRNS